MSSPLSESPPPTSIAVIALGNRYCQMIYVLESFSDTDPNNILSVSINEIVTEPKQILITKHMSNTISSPIK